MTRLNEPWAIIIAAVIGLIGVLVAGYFVIKGAQEPFRLSLQATQTAEARLTPFVSTPASTMDAISIVYDNFDNPAFDGKWNTKLWSRAIADTSSPDAIQQQNGVLNAKSQSSYAGLSSAPGANFLLSELDYVETRLMLEDDFQGMFGSISLGLVSNDTNANFEGESGNWVVSCHIETCQTASWCETPDRPVMKCFSPTGYNQISGIEVNYNTWHTARIGVDFETTTFYFYFDGHYYDAYTPSIANELKDDTFRVEVGSVTFSDSSSAGSFDDVRIIKLIP